MEDWSDEKFLGYMEIHSKTERALFRGDYIDRLCDMAGERFSPLGKEVFQSWEYDNIMPYLEAARENLTT